MSKPVCSGTVKRRRILIVAIIGYFLVTLITFGILFICAGTIKWLWGWAVAVIWLVGGIISVLITDSEVMAERSKFTRGAKSWDVLLAPIVGEVGPLIILIIAGLDFRFGWTGSLPEACGIIGVLFEVVGFAITIWAVRENKFFSYAVRLQRERGQYVVSTGPYHLVRHPGYVGCIIVIMAWPFALMSWWALAPALITTIVAIVRTALEDATLKRELEGYTKYAEQVRYRLLPGIW